LQNENVSNGCLCLGSKRTTTTCWRSDRRTQFGAQSKSWRY